MADIFEIEVDLDLLKRNLKASGEADTMDKVLQVLKECGFRRQESGLWWCEEISLQCLDAAEILRKRQVG